jgi:pimeloyl-ACP methyl ester carboxylesterase
MVEDFDLVVFGHRLRARWIKAGSAARKDHPPLVFLHEGLGCIQMWGDFPDQVARMGAADALVFDRLGHGQSDPLPCACVDPQFLRTEAHRFLPEILAQCGIARCMLIGHSDGGSIALLYAAEHPQQVAAVITEGAHVFVDPVTINGIQQAVQAFRHLDLASRLRAYHGDNLENLFKRWSETWLSDQFRDWDIRSCLPSIRCPVLAIQGVDDEYGTAEQAEAIATRVGSKGRARFIPGCRHIPHHQARRPVMTEIERFFKTTTEKEGDAPNI